MKIQPLAITVSELLAGYVDNGEGGVRGYGGRLDIRPPYRSRMPVRPMPARVRLGSNPAPSSRISSASVSSSRDGFDGLQVPAQDKIDQQVGQCREQYQQQQEITGFLPGFVDLVGRVGADEYPGPG